VGGLTCVEQLSIGAFPPSTTRSAICGRLPTAWAVRSSWVYKDHGISGTKGRDRRPAFDKLCRDAARTGIHRVAWCMRATVSSVDNTACARNR